MTRNQLTGTVTAALAILLAALAYFGGWLDREEPAPVAPLSDLSKHPVYSEYEFGPDDRVIDVGMQPVWIPTNIIAETMRRDTVLRKALARRGFEIRFHGFWKGADVNFFLGRGDLEVGIGGDMPALTAAVKHDVAVTSVMQRGFCSVVAREHMLMRDLAGQRIAYPFGSISHFTLLRSLRAAGLDEEDVRLIPMDVKDMPAALDREDVDAFAAWEPTPSIAKIRCRRAVVIHASLSTGYLYFARRLADKSPEVLREIVASHIRAMKWFRGNRDRLRLACTWAMQGEQALAGEKTPLSAKTYLALALKDLLGITSVPAIPEADLEASGTLARELEFLKKTGKIPEDVRWSDVRACFEPEIVAGIMAEGRKYQLGKFEYDEAGQAAGPAAPASRPSTSAAAPRTDETRP